MSQFLSLLVATASILFLLGTSQPVPQSASQCSSSNSGWSEHGTAGTGQRSLAVPGPPPWPWGWLQGVGGTLLVLPRRGEKNETGCVGQSGKERRAALCSVQPTHPRPILHQQPFWHGGPIENAILIMDLPSLRGYIQVSGKPTMPTSAAELRRPHTSASLSTPAAGWFDRAMLYSFGKSWEES